MTSAAEFIRPRIPNGPILSFPALFGVPSGGDSQLPNILQLGAILRLTSGRAAIALALKELGVGPGAGVLLPAYNCRAMVDAIRWTGATPVLYKSKKNLSVDLEDVARRTNTSVRCLIIVHYFGFPQEDLRGLRAFCDRMKIALLEDCAHCFFGAVDGDPIGSFGDFAVASPTKFFPVYDGGLLVSARREINGVKLRTGSAAFQVKSVLNLLERSFGYSRLRPLNWLMTFPLYMKDLAWSTVKTLGAVPPREGFAPDAAAYTFDPAWADVRMSKLSTGLLNWASRSRVISRRRSHYQRLAAAFRDMPGCKPLFPNLDDGVVPYAFPLLVDDWRHVFTRLKTRGVPLFRWEDVDPTVCEFGAEYSNDLFQLPCHQELSTAEIDWVISEVEEALSESTAEY